MAYSAFRPAPVRRNKDLKTGDVVTGNARHLRLARECPQINVLIQDENISGRALSFLDEGNSLWICRTPIPDRPCQIASLDDLRRVLLQRQFGLAGQFFVGSMQSVNCIGAALYGGRNVFGFFETAPCRF